MPLTYTPIATQTLGSSASSVTFSSIPATYTDLIIVASPVHNSTIDNIQVQFNLDTTSNYSRTRLIGNGTTASSDRNSSQTSLFAGLDDTGRSTTIIQVMNYANTTTFKTVLTRSNLTGYTSAEVGLWRKTPEAINQIKLFHDSGNTFQTGSTFSLYGILAA
jgi:hypothetical protein